METTEISSEERRKGALASQNGLLYAELCDSLGIVPEDQKLYDSGLAERIGLESKDRKLVELEEERPYRELIRRTSEIGLNVQQLSSHPDTKLSLLEELFPLRFGREKGRQNISRYTSGQIGAVFRSLYRYAEGRLKDKQ